MRFVNSVLVAIITVIGFSGCGGGENIVVEPPQDYQPTAQEVAEVKRMMDAREQESRARGR